MAHNAPNQPDVDQDQPIFNDLQQPEVIVHQPEANDPQAIIHQPVANAPQAVVHQPNANAPQAVVHQPAANAPHNGPPQPAAVVHQPEANDPQAILHQPNANVPHNGPQLPIAVVHQPVANAPQAVVHQPNANAPHNGPPQLAAVVHQPAANAQNGLQQPQAVINQHGALQPQANIQLNQLQNYEEVGWLTIVQLFFMMVSLISLWCTWTSGAHWTSMLVPSERECSSLPVIRNFSLHSIGPIDFSIEKCNHQPLSFAMELLLDIIPLIACTYTYFAYKDFQNHATQQHLFSKATRVAWFVTIILTLVLYRSKTFDMALHLVLLVVFWILAQHYLTYRTCSTISEQFIDNGKITLILITIGTTYFFRQNPTTMDVATFFFLVLIFLFDTNTRIEKVFEANAKNFLHMIWVIAFFGSKTITIIQRENEISQIICFVVQLGVSAVLFAFTSAWLNSHFNELLRVELKRIEISDRYYSFGLPQPPEEVLLDLARGINREYPRSDIALIAESNLSKKKEYFLRRYHTDVRYKSHVDSAIQDYYIGHKAMNLISLFSEVHLILFVLIA